MKKVCIITTAHPAGDNRIFFREINSLSNKYHVDYITTAGDLPTHKRIAIHYIGCWDNRLQRVFGNFKAFKMARGLKVDLYHFHDPEFVPFAVLLKWLTKKPVIYDIHENYPAAVLGREWIPVYLRRIISVVTDLGERLTITFISHLFTASEAIDRRYSRLNPSTTIINNYPNEQIINDSHLARKKSGPFQVVCLGNLNEIRGARIVFEALRAFLPGREAEFVLVGKLEPQGIQEELLKGLDAETLKKVNITGTKPYEEAISLTAEADLGLLTYLPVPNHLECSPNKLYEYMGLGLPLLVSDLPNYGSVVRSESAGFVYEAESSKGLTEKLISAYENKPELKKIGKKNRELFLKKYNWSVEEEKLFRVYKELIGE